MNILLLGKNGQLGWELQRALAPLTNVIALGRNSDNGLVGDLNNLASLRATIRTLKPNIIVNAAAYTAVDGAEDERELAYQVNTEAPAVLAEEARAIGALLVHYSTDYVFSGEGDTPWTETDPTAPVNYYGLTKLLAEQAIQQSGCDHLIFRTSWVFSSRRKNFLTVIKQLISERENLSVVNDQIGSPTSAQLIADITAKAIAQYQTNPELAGLYHMCAQGEVSRHGFTVFIANQLLRMGQKISATPDRIQPIPTAEYPLRAVRPLNSRLDTAKFETTFGIHLPNWQNGVVDVLSSQNKAAGKNR